MPYEKDPKERGAAWVRVSQNGTRYMTGYVEVNGQKLDIVMFENKKKTGKQPDWKILESTPLEGQSAGTRNLDTREAPRRDSRVDDTDSEIPF